MSHATDECKELHDEQDGFTDLLSWYLLQPPQTWPTAEQTAPQDTTPTITEILAEPSLATMYAATDICAHRQDELTRIKLMELCREIELKMSVPWNASTPTLERNGHWHSPLDSNAHSESSDDEPLPTTRPPEASAKPIAQRDVITEITCNASLEHDAEQHAQDTGQNCVDGSTPRELLPQVHIWPDPATPKYKYDADGTMSTHHTQHCTIPQTKQP